MQMAVIFKSEPSVVKLMDWETYLQSDWSKDEMMVAHADTWEDVERFAHRHKATIDPGIKRPRPCKALYSGFYTNDEGFDDFSFQYWAHSKADVIEHLRQKGSHSDWWSALKRQVAENHDGIDIDKLPAYDVLEYMDKTDIDGDSESAFRIIETFPCDIEDIRVVKKRRQQQ